MGFDTIPTYPSEYDPTGLTNNPPGTDSRKEGDDQFRILKANMNKTWANVAGAVTASHEEINKLTGISLTEDLIQFESGVTKALFYNDVAPNGWAIDSVPDDTMVRITKGLAGGGVQGGTITGTYAFSAVFTDLAEGASPGVGNHTLIISEMPPHNHPGSILSPGGDNQAGAVPNIFSTNTGRTATLIIASQGGGGAHGHTFDLKAKASACIIATKS